MSKVYLTSALPYVNSSPHIGFAYEIVFSDVLARYFRQKNFEVCFLTGTDENSFKIARVAREKGLTPSELADKNSKYFKELKNILNISYDIFYRTSSDSHKKGSQNIWNKINKNDIYRDTWSSWYCVGCESFYSKDKLVKGLYCPEHLKELEYVEEQDYFFKFDNYRDRLIEIIEKKEILITPHSREKEVIREIKEFKNFNISRKRESDWGVALPDSDQEVIYTFLEALIGYINGLGYQDNRKRFQYWWEDDKSRIIHIIGKGITRFHTIYWPSLLCSCGLRLPTDIIIHDYVTIHGQKVSKSLGNIINIYDLIETNGIDSVRFYLMKNINPFLDTDFDESSVSNEFKNFNKSLTYLYEESKYRSTITRNGLGHSNTGMWIIDTAIKDYEREMELFNLNKGLGVVVSFINQVEKDMLSDKKAFLSSIELSKIFEMLNPFIPQTVLDLKNDRVG